MCRYWKQPSRPKAPRTHDRGMAPKTTLCRQALPSGPSSGRRPQHPWICRLGRSRRPQPYDRHAGYWRAIHDYVGSTLLARDPFRKTRNESVAVGHLHSRQCLGVDRQPRVDQLVLRQDVGRQSIDVVIGEGARLGPRHRPSNVVEQRRRIGPVVGDGRCRFIDAVDLLILDQCGSGGRALTQKDSTLATVAMAKRAVIGEDRGTLLRGTAPGRQAGATGFDVYVPLRKIGGSDRLSEVRAFAMRAANGEGQGP